ncbi:hypothetical protein D3C80_2001560 [compost metagenome]
MHRVGYGFGSITSARFNQQNGRVSILRQPRCDNGAARAGAAYDEIIDITDRVMRVRRGFGSIRVMGIQFHVSSSVN